jgi:thymidylate kinase
MSNKRFSSRKKCDFGQFFSNSSSKNFLIIDIWRFGKLYKKLKKENFDYIVSDRYFFDNIVNIYYLSKSEKNIPCERFIKSPDLAIYLQADPEKIMQRSRKPDQGIKYLKDKKEIFEKIFEKFKMVKIDGNRDEEEIFEEIKKLFN